MGYYMRVAGKEINMKREKGRGGRKVKGGTPDSTLCLSLEHVPYVII